MTEGTVYPLAGRFWLWDVAGFEHIEDYDAWEAALGTPELVAEHIRAGALVPVDVPPDTLECQVRIQQDAPPEPALRTDGPHDFVASGRGTYVSDLQAVGGVEWDNTLAVPLPKGHHTVRVHHLQDATVVLQLQARP